QFDLDLFTSPEQFFRLGLVTNDFGPVVDKETETTTITNGVTTIEERREIEKGAFKFNLQIGRQMGRFAFRAGLIETSGGIGMDYFLYDYGLKFGAELFDYQEHVGPNFRLFSELRLWSVLY